MPDGRTGGASLRDVRADRRRLAALARLIFIAALTLSPAAAHAQQYLSDPVDERADRYRALALSCAKGTNSYAAEKAKIEEFFVKFYFPKMTHYGPIDLAKLGTSRIDLFRRYLWLTSDSQYQSDLTEWAFNAAKQMVLGKPKSPPYHPAVRYNGVLILGLLDAEYAIETGPNRRPPKPLPKANEFLVLIVNSAAAGKAVPPSLLAGALVGLERHATYRGSLPRPAVEAMAAASLNIVNQEKPALEMDRQVHAWMRLKAAGILAQLGSVGDKNQVHDALVKLLNESKSLDDRCRVAALLAKLNYKDAKIDGPAAAKAMLVLARDVAADESKHAEEFRDLRFTGGGGVYSGSRSYYGGRGEGGGYVDPGEGSDDYPRRRPAVARLVGLRAGLTALKPALPEEAQAKFQSLLAAIDPAINAAANKDTIPLDVANALVTMASAVTAVTGVAPGDRQPVDDADEFAVETTEMPAAVPRAAAAPAKSPPAPPADTLRPPPAPTPPAADEAPTPTQ